MVYTNIGDRWNCFPGAFVALSENYIVLVKTNEGVTEPVLGFVLGNSWHVVGGSCCVWNSGLLYVLLGSHLWLSQHKFLTTVTWFSHCLDTAVWTEGAVLIGLQSVTSQFLCCHLLRVEGTQLLLTWTRQAPSLLLHFIFHFLAVLTCLTSSPCLGT